MRATAALLAALAVATWAAPDGAAVPAPANAETLSPLDEFPPPPVAPLPPARWIGRNEFPLAIPVEASSPSRSQPASAIAGYAYSASLRPGEAPCADRDRCAESETVPDLGGAFSLPTAPEGGAVWLRVVAVSGAGLSSSVPGEATLRVDLTDPTTRLLGVPGGWSRAPVRLRATAADGHSGMAGERAFTAIRVDGGPPRVAPGAAVEATVIEEGAHRVEHYAGDSAGNADDGAWVNGHHNPPPGAATVRIDRTPPRAGFLPQNPLDPEAIRVRVRDALSGPDLSRGWIGVRPAGSVERFRRLPTAHSGSELRARWDSAAYPPGAYEFRAEVRDAAGNAAATERREGGAPMLLASPLKTTTSLGAGFGGRVLHWYRCRRRGKRRHCRRQRIVDFDRRPPRRAVPYGRRLPISGRLVAGPNGAPGPRPVRVVERFAPGARPATRATTVWTATDGSFTARLAPGPSREVRASYAGGRMLAPSAGPTLRLQVRSGVRLRASSRVARVGGAPLVLRGKLRARRGEIPPAGLTVRFEFRLPGLRWEEFRTVRTDRRGRFRLAYRFSDDDSRGARFQFRAHVPAQAGWPYSPGSSRPIQVQGR